MPSSLLHILLLATVLIFPPTVSSSFTCSLASISDSAEWEDTLNVESADALPEATLLLESDVTIASGRTELYYFRYNLKETISLSISSSSSDARRLIAPAADSSLSQNFATPASASKEVFAVVASGQRASLLFEGLHVKDFHTYAGVVRAQNADITLTNCAFENNWSYGQELGGAALTLFDATHATVTHTIFKNNIGGYHSGQGKKGVVCLGGGGGSSNMITTTTEFLSSTSGSTLPGAGSTSNFVGVEFDSSQVDTATFAKYEDIIFVTVGSDAASNSAATFATCQEGFTGSRGSSKLGIDMDVHSSTDVKTLFTGQDFSFACAACEAGKFKREAGLNACTSCPSGTFSTIVGATTNDGCQACPTGKILSGLDQSSDSNCAVCPVGRYGNDGMECLVCPEGTYNSAEGSFECTDCPKGSFGNITEALKCHACDAGTYSQTTRAVSCQNCPSGKFGTKAGEQSAHDACESCPPGRYSEEGSLECELCADGLIPKNGKMCESCRPGQVPSPNNSTCVTCPLNTYNPDAGGTSCLSCPTNEFTSTEGSRECKTCGQSEYFSGGECVDLKIDKITPSDRQSNPTRGGGLLEIEGEGFKPPPPFNIVVEMDLEPPVPCEIVSATSEKLTVRLPAGTGATNTISVRENMTDTAYSLKEKYVKYLEPEVWAVRGCPDQNENKTAGCQTTGNHQITVSGSNFGPYGASVNVGGLPCEGVVHSETTPHESLVCTLPAGTGVDQPVMVTVDGQSSYAELVTYSSAAVTGFSGCDSDGCPRDGISESGERVVIEVTGTNFGPDHAFAVVGGKLCAQAPVPDGVTFDPHTTLYAFLEPGAGKTQTLSVLQKGGTFGDPMSLVNFKQCDAGTYNIFAPELGRTICRPCDQGSYADDAESWSCEVCPAGYFTNSTLHCEACPAHKTSEPKSPSCHCKPTFEAQSDGSCMCPPGKEWDQSTDSCNPCAMHHYQSDFNLGSCLSCDTLVDGSSTENVGSNSSSFCICEKDFYNDGSSCVACTEGMDCATKGVTLEDLTLKEGYWRHSANTTDIRVCPKENLCLGGKHGQYCPEFNKGPYCLVCKDGAGGNWESECKSCSDTNEAMTEFFILIGGILVGGALALVLFKRFCPPNSARGLQVMFKIVLAGSQIITAIPSVFDIKLPTKFEGFLDSVNFINMDLFGQISAGCLADVKYWDLLLWTCLLPFILAGLVLVYFAIKRVMIGIREAGDRRHESRHRTLKHTTATLLFLLSYVAYPGASMAVFSIFPCDKIGTISYLKADYSIKCYTDVYSRWTGFAWIMFFVYPVGVPLMYSVLLFRNRQRINPKEGSTVDDKMRIRDADLSIKKLSFLWVSYKPSCWWFEIFECCRRLLMTGGLVFISQGSPLQVSCGLCITFFSLFCLCWFKPYVTNRDNLLACFQQVNQFLILTAVILIVSSGTTSAGVWDDSSLAWMMIFLYSASGIFLLVSFAFQVFNEVGYGKDGERHREFDIDVFLAENLGKQQSSGSTGLGMGVDGEIVVGGAGGVGRGAGGGDIEMNEQQRINPLVSEGSSKGAIVKGGNGGDVKL